MQVGQIVSHYKIIEKLGGGGMGVVYKAQDTKLDRFIALKFLPPGFGTDEDEKQRFIHEAKAASALDHPNICAIHEIDETEDGQLFIVMACYDGETLKKKIERGNLKVDSAIDLAIQIAEGLTKAHKKDIIHRDIKPANILVTEEGVVKIVDFGLAKLAGQTKLTKATTTLGTAAYMSPEQTRGDEVDSRSDIWSFGVVLYEMLTGQLPFKGDYDQAVMYSILNEDPEPATALRTGIPMELELIINKALEKESEVRYQHVDEMLADLKRVKRDTSRVSRKHLIQTPEVEERLPVYAQTPTPKRHLHFIIPGAILLVLIACGYWLLTEIQKPATEKIGDTSEQHSIAIMYFENNTGDERLDHWRKALAHLIISDLSQSRYLKVMSSDKILEILTQLDQLDAETYSSEVLQKVAEYGKIQHIAYGNYMKAGEQFRINVSIQNIHTDKSIGTETVEGIGEEHIFNMIDELTRRIKRRFNLSRNAINSDIDSPIGDITTNSPEAYKYYIEGFNYHWQGEFNKALPLYKRAVEIDSEFVKAYLYIGWIYAQLGYPSEKKRYFTKCFELRHRVSEKERFEIEGDYFNSVEHDDQKAIDAYSKVVDLSPDDVRANHMLGYLYLKYEQWDKAIEQVQKIVQNQVNDFWSYDVMASAYRGLGSYVNAKKALDVYTDNLGKVAPIHRALADYFIGLGNLDNALNEAEIAYSIDPNDRRNIFKKGEIYLYKEELIQAELEFKRLLEKDEPAAHLMAREGLGALYLLQGKLTLATNQFIQTQSQKALLRIQKLLTDANKSSEHPEKHLNSIIETEEDFQLVGSAYLKGLKYISIQKMKDARIIADSLKKIVENGLNRNLIRRYYHLMGLINLESQNYSKAIELLKDAQRLLPYESLSHRADFIESLALAYYKSGDLDKALQEYVKITKLTSGRLYYGDIYARSFYWLGRIYEAKNHSSEAIAKYRKFLEIWKDADKDLPECVDTKSRLSKLKGEI